MNFNPRWILLFLLSILAFGCGGGLKLHEWQKLPKTHYTIPPYAEHLAGLKIALDPGHGGMAHLPRYKRGPSGKREAIMNLKVAFFLKEFLEMAGAEVFMTREDDSFISLRDRVDMAEQAGSDILISLHHNAAANPNANYAAVFYHMHPDSSPVSMDLARHIYFGLVEALHLPQLSQEGLLPDKLIYPAGFGLLRRARIPAVLLESSFYSNKKEEKRLMRESYNRREAYGIFLGLARWAAGGLPKAELLQPIGISRTKKPEIVYRLHDGITERVNRDIELLAFSESISLKIDSQKVAAAVDMKAHTLQYTPDSALTNGAHLLQVELQNLYKNHNLPHLDTLIIAAPTDSIRFTVPSDSLPADGVALMPVRLALFDADGWPVWQETEVAVRADAGQVIPEKARLSGNGGIFYYRAGTQPDTAHIIAQADGFSDTLRLRLLPTGSFWTLSGIAIDDSTKKGLAGAEIRLDDSLRTWSDRNGAFYIEKPPVGLRELEIRKRGFFPYRAGIQIDSVQSRMVRASLEPVLSGLLHDETIIIDAALGGEAQGDTFATGATSAAANLALAQQLAARLDLAGANVILIREADTTITPKERIEKVNTIPDGWYLKLAYHKQKSDSLRIRMTIYPANRDGEQVARHLEEAFGRDPKVLTTLAQNTDIPEVTNTNKTALELSIYCKKVDIMQRDLPALLRGIVAYYREMKKKGEKLN